ncbi:MAG: transglycosylase [Xanthobacteraceae bacterium]
MSRRRFLSGTSGTILLFAGLISAAAIVPATLPDLPESNIIQSNPFRRGDRESLAAIGGALATLRQALAHFRSDDAIPPPAVPKDLSYLADYAYSETPPDKKPAEVVLESLQDIPVGTPVDEIKLASDAFGLDFTFMKAVARIESDFDPTQRTGSYIGLFQLSHYEFDRYGSGDITSPRDNAIAAAYKFATEAALFEIDTHVKATLLDLYLIHQQGWQGAAEHIAHPERVAWQSMCATDEGHQKGEKWCKRAIWQNTLPDIKRAYKSVDNLTSAAFTEMWGQRLAMFYARYSETVSAK